MYKTLNDVFSLFDISICLNAMNERDFVEPPLNEILLNKNQYGEEMLNAMYYLIKDMEYSKISLVPTVDTLDVFFYDENNVISIYRWKGNRYVSTGYFD